MILREEHGATLRSAVVRFQELCVQKGVLTDRGPPLGEKAGLALAAGKLVDPRAPRLATISGKGGWHKDPATAARRARFRNVSLLDHALSVGRGGAVIVTVFVAGADPDIGAAIIDRNARLALALGLLHDLDKDLGLNRDTELLPEQVAERVSRYCIDALMREVGVGFTPEQWRALVATVEDSQSNRYRAGVPGWADATARAVRLADKLDGAFLEGTPAEGAAAVLRRLDDKAIRQQFPALGGFTILRLRDPHHPFLLEELLRQLSTACERITGLRPLVEMCGDGELIALLPKQEREAIVERGLDLLMASLRRRLFGFSIEVTNRQSTKLKGARPDAETFRAACDEGVTSSSLRPLFAVSRENARAFVDAVGPAVRGAGLTLAPGTGPGQTVPVVTFSEDLSAAARELLARALAARGLLGVSDASAKQAVKGLRDALVALAPDAPRTIAGFAKAEDQALALALIAAAACGKAETRAAFDAAVTAALPGCTSGMPDVASQILDEVRGRFTRLLVGRAIPTGQGRRRCLFTDEPVPDWMPDIEDADRLHGVKVSAFSGRSGRPEGLTLAKGVTAVSPASYVERRLQAWVHERARDGGDGIPLLVTSPASVGLFAALTFRNDDLRAISTYELLVQDPRKAHVTVEEAFERRYMLARFEALPARLEDQLGLIDRLLRVSLKLGRPLHVFAGLPEPRPEMFYMDAMPEVVASLLDGRGQRLERFPEALERLRLACILVDKGHGLGPDFLALFVHEPTQFRTAAFAARQLRLRGRDGEAFAFDAIANESLEGARVAESDKPLIRLGELAARVQRVPYGGASRSDETLIFRTCLEAATGLSRMGMGSPEELAAGIVGRLTVELVGNDKQAGPAGEKLRHALEELARLFAEEVWSGPCRGRAPANADRRLMEAVFVAALTRAWRLNTAARRTAPAAEKD